MVLWHFKLFRERQTTQTLISGVKCKTKNYTDTLTEESASVYTVEVFKNPSPVRIRPKEEYLPPPAVTDENLRNNVKCQEIMQRKEN